MLGLCICCETSTISDGAQYALGEAEESYPHASINQNRKAQSRGKIYFFINLKYLNKYERVTSK